MSGHHPFSNLTRGLSPERRRRVESIKAELVAEMLSHERRRAEQDAAREISESREPEDD